MRDVPEDRRIEFRIGVNLGDVIVEGDDIFGDGVNVAARLEGIAEPGGVAISGHRARPRRQPLDLAFEDMGEQTFKNIERPVRVYQRSRSACHRPNESSLAAPKCCCRRRSRRSRCFPSPT